MSSTLSKTHDLQQHAVVQALAAAYQSFLPKIHHKPTLWLTCSGGRDSLGLALAFVLLRQHPVFASQKLPIKVIHVNHHLQDAAAGWAALVQQFCQQHGLDFYCQDVHFTENKQNDAAQQVNENQARMARFQAFYQLIQPQDVLVLAHHADDQAETLLMNLCKGTGLAGLAGMAVLDFHTEESNQQHQPHWRWRPWLGITRKQITHFCEEAQLAFVNDPTNTAGDNTRAFLRTEILPKLHTRWQQAAANIARAASIVAEAKSTIDAQITQDLQAVCMESANAEYSQISICKLLALPQPRQYALLSAWLQGKNTYAPARHLVLQVANLAHASPSSVADTKTSIRWQHCQIKRYDDTLFKLPVQPKKAQSMTHTATLGSHVTLVNGQWQIALVPAAKPHATEKPPASLPASLLNQPLTFRPVQAGERLKMAGKTGSSLKKFFQHIRLPTWQRQQAYVLCVADGEYDETTTNEQPLALLCHKGFFVVENASQQSEEETAFWHMIKVAESQ